MPEFLNMTHIGLKMLMAKEEIDIVSQAERIPVSMKYGKRDCLPCSMSCMTCSRSCLFHLMLLIGVLVTPHSLWPFTREQMLPTLHGPLWFPCTLSTPLSIVSSLNSPMFICLLPVPYLLQHCIKNRTLYYVYILTYGESGEGNANPLQYSRLENLMSRGGWQSTVCGVSKNQTWLSN